MNKKLVKKEDGRIICGVCAGVADYLNVDPTAVRVVWALSCLVTGLGIAAYAIAAVLMPVEN